MRLADRSRKARDVVALGQFWRAAVLPGLQVARLRPGQRLLVYDIKARRAVKAASGNIRGFSFSLDSKSVVFGTSGTDDSFDAPSDLYRIKIDGGTRARITRDRKSLNPLWGEAGIIHDRQRPRKADARPTTCSRSSPTAAACAGSPRCASRTS